MVCNIYIEPTRELEVYCSRNLKHYCLFGEKSEVRRKVIKAGASPYSYTDPKSHLAAL